MRLFLLLEFYIHAFELRIGPKSNLLRISFKHAISDSVPGHKLEMFGIYLILNYPFLVLGMVVWTLTSLAFSLLTFLSPINCRMIVKLLPSMAHRAINSILTPFVIVDDVFLEVPIETINWLVTVLRWLSPIILKIVSINAFTLIVLS
jgi:hypothetical protein